jgi:DNA-binding IclR family transcriptional regulator
MVKREKANYLIQSVSHAIDVLEEFCGTSAEVGVTELSKRLKLHKNNVFRLLATLELRGFVEQNHDSENYRLGPKALQLGQAYVQHSSLVARAVPILKNLSDKIGETVSLAVLQNGVVQYPVSIESKRPVKVAPRMAISFPAKVNAAGRLLTAQLPDAVLAELLATNTPQDAAIKNQLSELRSSGQLIDRGATEADVISICRLVRGSRGDVVGAVEVLIPQYRAKIEGVMPSIDEAVSALSAAMGAGRNNNGGLASSMEKEVSRSGLDERPTRAE